MPTLIMKFTIILGFFATILAISASPLVNSDVQCVQVSEKLMNAVEKCMENVPEETLENFMSYNKTTATREIRCLASCLYTESGQFVDGIFDPEALEKYVREYVGSPDVLDKFVAIDQAAAIAANAEEGDDCDKTYAFHVSSGTVRIESGMERIFC